MRVSRVECLDKRSQKDSPFPLFFCVCVPLFQRGSSWTRDKDIIHSLAYGMRRKYDPGTLLIALFVTPNHVIVLTISRWVRVPGFQDKVL